MKKLLFVAAFFAFIGCSSSDESEKEPDLQYIQIKVTSEDIPSPNGNVYLFKVSDYDIKNDQPVIALDYSPQLAYISNGETKYMLPISSFGKESSGNLLVDSKNSYSVHSIYWYDLSTIYGTPKAGDEYLIYVTLRNGTYGRAYKRFKIEKSGIINVSLPSCTEFSKFVDATWNYEIK